MDTLHEYRAFLLHSRTQQANYINKQRMFETKFAEESDAFFPMHFFTNLTFFRNIVNKPKGVQSRVVTGLLTGRNTLRRHLYLLGLLDSPLCWKCGVREETSAHILCECEALTSLIHAYLGSFFLEPEDIRSLGLGAIWNYNKVTGLP